MLALPASASADELQVIDFDTVATNTALSSQYAPQGVSFTGASPASGLPRATDVGEAAASSGVNVAMSTCYGCEFVPHVVKATFSTLRRTVSLRAGVDAAACNWPVTLQLAGYSAGGTLLTSDTQSVEPGSYHQLLSIDAGSSSVASVLVRTSNPAHAGCRFGIDDLSYDVPAVVPPADFSLEPLAASVELRQGASATVALNLNRFNGSNGNIALGAGSLSGGVAGLFATNPVSGLGMSSLLTLSATNAAALNEGAPLPITLTGTPGDAGVGPATRTATVGVRVVRNFRVQAPTTIDVPSCGTGTGTVYVPRAIGYTGTVGLAASGMPAGVSAAIVAPASTLPTDGALATSHQLRLTAAGTGGEGSNSTITVMGSNAPLPAQSTTLVARRVAGSITSFTPTTASAPRDLQPGTLVTINGTGLCVGSHVQFGNALADVVPAAAAFAAGGTSVQVRVPRLATSGPITVVTPTGARLTSPGSITVGNYRNTEGFAFDNYDHPGVSWGDLESTFGSAETNISVNPCWPWTDCTIVTPFPSPLTGLFLLVANEALEGEGSCFGIAVTSQQIATGRVPLSRFTPAGATNAFGLNAATGPGTALRTNIRRWHVVQFSSEFIQSYVSTMATNPVRGAAHVRSVIESELAAGRNPMIALRDRGGHVLVAHDVRPGAVPGAFLIDVYDPNLPFLATEVGDAVAHRNRADASVIEVGADGRWTDRGAYSGGAWHGGLSALVQVPFGQIPTRPHLPTSPSGLLSLIVPLAGGGEHQVSDNQGRELLGSDGQVNTDAGTAIPGAGVFQGLTGSGNDRPIYAVPRGTEANYESSMPDGTSYGTALLAPGFAAHVDGINGSGKADRLRLDAAAGEIGINPADAPGAMQVALARTGTDGSQRGASLAVRTGSGATQTMALSAGRSGGLTYEADGAATIDITLQWAGKGRLPGSADLPAIKLARGENLNVQPGSWKSLGSTPVAMVIHRADGTLRASRTIKPLAGRKLARKVALSGRTARGNRRVITVRTRLARLPEAARVVQVLEVRRGSRLVTRRTRTVAAHEATRWTLPLRLRDASYTLRAATTVIVTAPTLESSTAHATTRFIAN